MQEFLRSCRYFFGYAFFFSMFVNVLQLTFSIYMLQVYDKVLTSYNLSTLAVITIAAVIALVVLALLEWIRSRLLVRAGIEFDRMLSLPVLNENLKSATGPPAALPRSRAACATCRCSATSSAATPCSLFSTSHGCPFTLP